jgi:2-polyprenyl-3-methyl-5-hydroxy-6-metoxy-1,4-benzoquinol methylase
MTFDLSRRNRQDEVMDRPDLDPVQHEHALRGLERANALSRSAGGILWPSVRDFARQHARPLRLLDIASGGGDVPIGLAKRVRRAGLDITIEGCDISSTAIEIATRKATNAGVGIRFFSFNAIADPLPAGYDIVTTSLFLHHLDEDDARKLFRRLFESDVKLVLVNDLIRSVLGYWLSYFVARIITRSPVVHIDGPMSVEGAFTPSEALALAQSAGWEGATVERRFPERFLLSWRRP